MQNDPKMLQIFRSIDEIDIIRVGSILAGAWLLVRAIERAMPWLAAKLSSRSRLSVAASTPVLRLLVVLTAIALLVPLLIRASVENFVAILGATGIAIGFALKDYASSLAAGIVAIQEKPYRPGDWIQIEDAYGEVQSVGFRNLRLLTPDDTVVIIPHKKIWDTSVHNANDGKREVLCVADFYLHPSHDPIAVRQKLFDVALTSPYLQLGRSCTVVASEKVWATHYRLKAYPVDGRDQFQFTTDLTSRGKQALTRLGVRPAAAPPNLAADPG